MRSLGCVARPIRGCGKGGAPAIGVGAANVAAGFRLVVLGLSRLDRPTAVGAGLDDRPDVALVALGAVPILVRLALRGVRVGSFILLCSVRRLFGAMHVGHEAASRFLVEA